MLATFAVARELLWWSGCHLLTLWTIAEIASWRGSLGVIRAMSRCRLPGARTVARVAIGASALGAALLTNSVSAFAAGGSAATTPSGTAPTAAAAPVLRFVGGVASAVGATPDAPPVLRYAGGPDQAGAGGRPSQLEHHPSPGRPRGARAATIPPPPHRSPRAHHRRAAGRTVGPDHATRTGARHQRRRVNPASRRISRRARAPPIGGPGPGPPSADIAGPRRAPVGCFRSIPGIHPFPARLQSGHGVDGATRR